MSRIAAISLLFMALFAQQGYSFAGKALQLGPTFIDRENGYVYFLVHNGWDRKIVNLFGSVYGYGLPNIPGAMLVNNPHSRGMKVSLGEHIPNSTAMYRFMLSTDLAVFPGYKLVVNDDSLFHQLKTGVYK